MIQDSFETYLKSLGPYLGDPKCFSYSYYDLQEAFNKGLSKGRVEGWREGFKQAKKECQCLNSES